MWWFRLRNCIDILMSMCMTVYFFFSLQRDEARKQCRDLSQELGNLRGELGKLGHLGNTAVFKVVISKAHTSGTGSAFSSPFRCVSAFCLDDKSGNLCIDNEDNTVFLLFAMFSSWVFSCLLCSFIVLLWSNAVIDLTHWYFNFDVYSLCLALFYIDECSHPFITLRKFLMSCSSM